MKLQYVFGNPTGKKKRRKKVAKKKTKRNPQRTRVTAFKKVKKKTKSGKTVTRKKKVQTRQGKAVASRADLHRLRALLSTMRAKIADARAMKAQSSSKTTKKALGSLIKKLSSAYNSANKKYKTKQSTTAAENKHINNLISDIKSAGMVAKKTKTVWKGKSVAKKKKAKKKTSRRKTKRKTKKKATKKASSRKKTKRKTKRKVTRKASTKKRSTRKKTKAKSSKRKSYSRKKKRSVSLKKGQSVTVKANPKKKKTTRRSRRRKNPFFGGSIMKKGNPMKVGGMQVAGYDPIELAELAAGGMFYGMANSYISPLIAKIPGLSGAAGLLGGTVPSIIVGVGMNLLADKVSGNAKKALEFVGDGLLGAAVVGAGVHLSQTLLPSPMAGVDYIPAIPGSNPDYGGVDYTPDGGYMSGMGDVQFTPGMSLPGQNPNVDFGKWDYEQDAADFGEVPEGLQGMN